MSLDPRGAGAYVWPPRGSAAQHTYLIRAMDAGVETFLGFNGGSAGATVITDPGTQLEVPYLGSFERILVASNHAAGVLVVKLRIYFNAALVGGPFSLPLAPLIPFAVTPRLVLPSPPLAAPESNVVSASLEIAIGDPVPEALWGTVSLDQEAS